MTMPRLWLVMLCLIVAVPVHAAAGSERGNTPTGKSAGKVVQLSIDGEIELGVSAYLKRGLARAQDDGASAVLLRINTPGGRLDAAMAMKDSLLESQIPVIAYIDNHALSAGALIALATHDIYMAPGGVIGAATPILGKEKASEKIVSGVRTTFAATAEARDRNPKIAEAMVDESVAIDGVISDGKLLSLTAKEAKKQQMITDIAANQQAVLDAQGLGDAQIVAVEPQLMERFVRFITSAQVAPLLMSFAMLAMLLELKAPGWGIAGLLSICAFALVFWGHHLAGLAGAEDVILFGIGMLLLTLEIFVIPGTGIAGVLGVVALFAGLFFMMVGDPREVPPEMLVAAASTIVLAAFGALIASVFVFKLLFKKSLFQSGLILASGHKPASPDKVGLRTDPGHASPSVTTGATGQTLSSLRPSGSALIDGETVEVTTRGQFLSAGESVTVTDIRGHTILVEPTNSATES